MNYTETDAFKDYEKHFLNTSYPRHADTPDIVPSLTVRDTYTDDPLGASNAVQRAYLSRILDSQDTATFNALSEELNLQGGTAGIKYLKDELAGEYKTLGGLTEFNKDKTYLQSYKLDNPIVTHEQNVPGLASFITPTGGADLYGNLQMGMGDQRNPTKENIESQQQPPRELNSREALIAAYGGNYTTSFLAEITKDQSYAERWDPATSYNFTNLTPESPILAQLLLLPANLTRQEGTEFIRRNYDPDAIVSYIDPQNITEGLKVQSPRLIKAGGPALVPFRDIGEGGFGLPSGDTTFRTREEMHGRMADELTQLVFGELGPEIIGSGGMIYMNHLLKKGGKEFIEKRGALKKLGIRTGEAGALAAATAIPAAMFKYYTHLQANESGILKISQERAAESAGIFGAGVFLGQFGSDLLLGVLGDLTNRFFGKNIDPAVINRMRRERAKFRKESERSEKELPPAEVNRVLSKISRKLGDDYAKSYTDLTPALELEGDAVLMDMQAAILDEMGESEATRVAIEQMYNEKGLLLEAFFTDLMRRAGVKPNATKSAYQDYLDLLEKTMGKEAKKRAAALEEKTAGRMLTDLEVETQTQALIEGVPLELRTADVPTVMGEQVSTAQNSVADAYGNRKSRLILARQNSLDAPAKELDKLISDEEVSTIPLVKLHEHLSEPIGTISKGGDAPIKAAEFNEARKFMKDNIPMEEGTSILKLLTKGKDEGATVEIAASGGWDLSQLIETRFNLMTWRGEENRLIRENAENLINGIDDAIDEALGSVSPELRKKILTGINSRITSYADNVDGRLLLEIVQSKNPSELATSVLKMSPDQTKKLIDLLEKTDLENMEIGSRVVALRQSVIEHLRKNIINEENAVKQNKQFREFMDQYGEQMELIFPEKWQSDRLKSFAKWSKEQENVIAVETKKLDDLNKIFASGEYEKLNPVKLIQDFFEADPIKFEEAGTMRRLQELSQLADKYPQLRQSMRNIFVEYMERSLLKPQATELSPEFKMSKEGFDITGLLKLAQGGYGGATGLKRMEANFNLLLGPGVGKDYVRHLRFLAREVDKINNLHRRARYLSTGKPDIATEEGDRTILRWMIPPLTQFGRRATALVSTLSTRSKRQFLKVVADPQKLDALLSLRDRQMDQRTAIKVLDFISNSTLGPASEDVGGQIEQETGDRKLTQFIGQPAAEKVEKLDRWIEATKEDVLKLASGGSVAAALQRAEARTRHVQRGR